VFLKFAKLWELHTVHALDREGTKPIE